MDLDLQQQVQKRLAELPEDVRQAVQSAQLSEKVQAVGKKNGLHIDQMGKLEDEVYLVMLGFADPTEFAATLGGEVGLTPAQAVAVATDVGNDIFKPIRASMQAWTEDKATHEDAQLVSEALAPEKPSKLPEVTPKPPTPVPPASTPVSVPPPSKPAPDLMAAEAMLSGKKDAAPAAPTAPKVPAATPSTTPAAKADPARPQSYKADPYREPTE